MDDLVIGIDLGTTKYCASIFMDGKLKTLKNCDGGNVTPSFIYFLETEEVVVGEHAKKMASSKPEHGIYDVKRLIGRTLQDLQTSSKQFPFTIEGDDNHDPVIVIRQGDKAVKKTPQELFTLILKKLKKDVETELGQIIQKVVITVPAYFSVRQREVALAAAEDAGFQVLKLLNDPIAAALNYYYSDTFLETTYSMVFDMGGGTLDVAILKTTSEKIEMISVDGDTTLGGQDFTNIIIEHICEELLTSYNYNPKSNKENMQRLLNQCEDVKKTLSTKTQTVITLIDFVDDNPYVQFQLSKRKFEDLAENMFKRAMEIVDNCVKTSEIAKDCIKDIILSGGTTNIPKLDSLIFRYFDGTPLSSFANSDECVAEGAALQAAMLSTNPKQQITKIVIQDVIPLSLGAAVADEEVDFMIHRNSHIPISETKTFVTTYNQQNLMIVNLFEGELSDVKRNNFIATVIMQDLSLAPPGECRVDLTMHVDGNGILHVKAKECVKNVVQELKVEYVKFLKDENEIEDIDNDDEDFKNLTIHKSYLIAYCAIVVYHLDRAGLVETHRKIYDFCKETQKFVNGENVKDYKRIKELIERVKKMSEPVLTLYDFQTLSELPNPISKMDSP